MLDLARVRLEFPQGHRGRVVLEVSTLRGIWILALPYQFASVRGTGASILLLFLYGPRIEVRDWRVVRILVERSVPEENCNGF